jgi:hypothetical protein
VSDVSPETLVLLSLEREIKTPASVENCGCRENVRKRQNLDFVLKILC